MKPSIMIATPMYGAMCHGPYAYSLLAFYTKMLERNWAWEPKFLYNESLITRARDDLAHIFLKSNHTHLLFLDSDIQFDPEAIAKMVEADKDIIGGCYPGKKIMWRQVETAVKGGLPIEALPIMSCEYVLHTVDENHRPQLGSSEPLEVQRIGTGMMLIKREVFEKLKPHVPTYKNNNTAATGEIVSQFFDCSIDPDTNHLLSEDYHFCNLWRKHGGQVYAAPWALGTHCGTHWFGAPFVD